MTEDEMVVWHHWLDGHESEQTLGDSEGQGSLVGCSPWGCKESDTTEQLSKQLSKKTKILISIYLNSLLKNYSAFLTCFATGSIPTLPPAHRKILFPNMNTYSELLPYRLCLLDWDTKYSTPSHSFSWEGCWAQGEGHGSQDMSGREAVRPWDIGLRAVTSFSFRTAIIISLEVAMTGPAWGANDLSEKLFWVGNYQSQWWVSCEYLQRDHWCVWEKLIIFHDEGYFEMIRISTQLWNLLPL